jgi:hypothetical protein
MKAAVCWLLCSCHLLDSVVALVWSVGWVVVAAAGTEAEVTDLGIARRAGTNKGGMTAAVWCWLCFLYCAAARGVADAGIAW